MRDRPDIAALYNNLVVLASAAGVTDVESEARPINTTDPVFINAADAADADGVFSPRGDTSLLPLCTTPIPTLLSPTPSASAISTVSERASTDAAAATNKIMPVETFLYFLRIYQVSLLSKFRFSCVQPS